MKSFKTSSIRMKKMGLTLSLAFLCKAKAAEQTSKPSTFSKQRNDLQDGITGCGEFRKGVQN